MKKVAQWLGVTVATILSALLLVRAWYEPIIPFPSIITDLIEFISEYYGMEGEIAENVEFLIVFAFAIFMVVLIGMVVNLLFKKLKALSNSK